MEKYQCCFCGEEILEYEKVTSILVTTNWQSNDDEKKEDQQFFCHLRHLKNTLHSSQLLYINED